MLVTLNGVLTDHLGRVMLRQADSTALAPVSTQLDPGVRPDVALADAFRAATGLIVMPVRLTGLYMAGKRADEDLTLLFRCTLRGGTLHTAVGQPRAGFFESMPLPGALGKPYRRRVEDALRHEGGSAIWRREGNALVHGRVLRGTTVANHSGPQWEVRIQLIILNEDASIGYQAPSSGVTWRLPGTIPHPGEAPWEAAGRLLHDLAGSSAAIMGLSGLYVMSAPPQLLFVFVAGVRDAPVARTTLRYAARTDPSIILDADDSQLVTDAHRLIDGPRLSGATVIGAIGPDVETHR